MSKITAVLGSALFFVVAPAMVAGLIPWLITHWEFRPPFLAVEATRLAGVAFIIAGVPGLLDSLRALRWRVWVRLRRSRHHAISW